MYKSYIPNHEINVSNFRKVTKIVSYMKSWEIGIGIRLRLLKEHKSGDFSYGTQDFLYL